MSLRRLFTHHSHGGHQRSRNPHSESSEEVQRSFSADHSDDTHEHQDIIPSFRVNSKPVYPSEQQSYRTRRRSSVPILDKKFIQTSSNQMTTSVTTDSDSNLAGITSEDVCEFYLVLFSFYYIFCLSHLSVRIY
jgi:hypothetical protein